MSALTQDWTDPLKRFVAFNATSSFVAGKGVTQRIQLVIFRRRPDGSGPRPATIAPINRRFCAATIKSPIQCSGTNDRQLQIQFRGWVALVEQTVCVLVLQAHEQANGLAGCTEETPEICGETSTGDDTVKRRHSHRENASRDYLGNSHARHGYSAADSTDTAIYLE